MEFEKLVKELNDLKILQKKIDWEENIPDDIWSDYFENNHEEVDSGLDDDSRRHYETSISVIKIYDRFLGIRHITLVFSESSYVEDCYHHLEFFEMEEKQTVTYIKKK